LITGWMGEENSGVVPCGTGGCCLKGWDSDLGSGLGPGCVEGCKTHLGEILFERHSKFAKGPTTLCYARSCLDA
jgi:hypothetical protein